MTRVTLLLKQNRVFVFKDNLPHYSTVKMVNLTEVSAIDVSNLEYHEPMNGKMGGQYVKITYNGSKVIFQTPKCYLPFGINKYEGAYGNTYSIDLSLSSKTQNMEIFEKFIEELDEQNIKSACKNSNSWLSKPLDIDDIKQIYKKQLRKSDQYPSLMRVKIPTNSVGPLVTVFDIDKNIIPLENIQKQSDVTCVLELTGLYFRAKEFGVSWKVIQIMSFPRLNLNEYAFVDDDSESDNEV